MPEVSKKAKPKAKPGATKAKKTTTKKVSGAKVPEGISKLRIRVKAYENKILDVSVKQIIDTAIRFDAKILGPVPLPTEKDKYTVNRSSFIYKIDILNPSPKVIEALTNISLPSGVSIDVKMI